MLLWDGKESGLQTLQLLPDLDLFLYFHNTRMGWALNCGQSMIVGVVKVVFGPVKPPN